MRGGRSQDSGSRLICGRQGAPGARPSRQRCNQRLIWTQEEIAGSQAPPASNLALSQMVRPVVQYVAALTERTQIVQPIIGRIAVQVRGREHDARHPKPSSVHKVGPLGHCAVVERGNHGRIRISKPCARSPGWTCLTPNGQQPTNHVGGRDVSGFDSKADTAEDRGVLARRLKLLAAESVFFHDMTWPPTWSWALSLNIPDENSAA